MKLYFEPYEFKKKSPVWIDADAAVRKISKGKRILIGSGCAYPEHLVNALMRNASCFRDNEIVHLLTVGEAPYTQEQFAESFRHNAFFIGKNVRDAVSSGNADYIPIFLSEVALLFKSGQMHLNCALIQVAPPDRDNYVSLGVSVDILLAGLASADIVIAQVNKQMPYTLGQARIPVTCIDYLVDCEEPLKEFPQSTPDDISLRIGKHLSRYIWDGDTLQLGIGNIPDAVLMNLQDKNNLGVHTEMISDGVVDLYKKGIINNKNKNINTGKSILSFVLGSKKLFEVIHQNPDFQFFPSEYTNDPFVVSQNNNMVSINSAIQIDLTGQICSDSIGSRLFSGFGGQVDFVRGANRSRGGRSFIAMPSTAKNWTVSRIVPFLAEGAGVVTSRADAHYVCTEYGIAFLHGRNLRDRGLSLIQIAHPKFRDQLLDYLKQKKYVFIDQSAIKDDDHPVKNLIPEFQDFKGKRVYFRILRPSDERTIQDFFYSHNPDTIYQRYLEKVEAMPHAVAQARVAVDYNKDMAIAGFDSVMPYAPMVCLGRYIRHENNEAEMGLVVKEDFQSLGIGTFLLKLLIEGAKLHEIKTLTANVDCRNVRMLKIYTAYGFKIEEGFDSTHKFVSIDIKKDPLKASK
jgi:acyl-CoA hydrolase/RimJ/RimL family protein N-acetyltransferase